MENTSNAQELLEIKLDKNYASTADKNNFVAEGEITVTITLNEYRDLLIDNARSNKAIDDIKQEKYSIQSKLSETTKQLEILRTKYYELRDRCGNCDKCVTEDSKEIEMDKEG